MSSQRNRLPAGRNYSPLATERVLMIRLLQCIGLNFYSTVRDFRVDWLLIDLNALEVLNRSVRKYVIFTEMAVKNN